MEVVLWLFGYCLPGGGVEGGGGMRTEARNQRGQGVDLKREGASASSARRFLTAVSQGAENVQFNLIKLESPVTKSSGGT